ncbi:MAG: glucose 1-dehydrogenase [Bacteroidia bacterium]|nr:glucose 1-dehydrogenase [Bacteroidia bacterium]
MRLENKIALISGAARGIGAAIAREFHRQGAFVIITDILDEEGLRLAAELGGKAVYRHLDVKHEQEWQELTAFLRQEKGRLDVMVNNAGITGFMEVRGPFDAEHADAESWEEVHRVNALGTMLGCKYAIQLMKQHGGSIINISSRSGIVGVPAAVAYASSKAAVRNHTKSVALYCAEKKYKIRCNSIHPAAILTPMWDLMIGEGAQREQQMQAIESGIPLGHFGDPRDVAFAALYLASEESRYITGIELNVDGGILAGSSAQTARK